MGDARGLSRTPDPVQELEEPVVDRVHACVSGYPQCPKSCDRRDHASQACVHDQDALLQRVLMVEEKERT